MTTGITGQSSRRGMCVWPNVYQTTRSRSARSRSAAVQLRQAVAARVLVGIFAGREPLLGIERGHPEVARQEGRPFQERCTGLGKGEGRLARAEPVRHRLAHAVLAPGVDDPPEPRRGRIGHALGRRLFERAASPRRNRRCCRGYRGRPVRFACSLRRPCCFRRRPRSRAGR